jgi:hypothetical protein
MEMRNACSIFVGKPEGKRLLWRLRCRQEDNIRMDVREIGWEDVDWIHLTQDSDQCWVLVNIVMKLKFS